MSSVDVLSNDGRTATLDDQELAEISAALRGSLISRDDSKYDSARQVYNGMIDKKPALIARCVNVADVIRAVAFARRHDLDVAIRGGGHSGAGMGTVDGGLVIDLSRMNGIRVDPVGRTARVEGGCTWGDVDHATHAFGLAVPSGILSTTGVGGLTLGGGTGYLTRRYGLTIDNLLEADLVLADGRFVTASDDQNEDLFWAIRGGGGNFGVVTSFRFRLHPVNTVYAGPMFWHLDQAREVLQWWREYIQDAPNDINGWFAFLTVPPGPHFPEELHLQKMAGIVWCYTGDPEDADEVFAPIRKVGPPALDLVGPLPYPALQSMFDALFPPGLHWYWRADMFNELSDDAIDAHLEYGSTLPTMLSGMHIYPINGAAHDVGTTETAFSHRGATFSQIVAGVSPDPADKELIKDWTVSYWEALHPYSVGGAYVNFLMDEGQERVRATYGDNYDHLVEIKNKYDPTNVFHVNQNIQPTV